MRLVLIIVFSLVSFAVTAQPSDPTPENPTVPISGIEILIAAGAALGVRRFFATKDKNKE